MQDSPNGFDTPMQGLPIPQWLEKIEDITEEHGYFQNLGTDHYATFVEDKPTLLVTFESIEGIQRRGDNGQPLGFELVRELGWSHLCLLSHGQSWYRDPAVYAFFDRVSDEGFFDEFDDVLFYGVGPAGYAACAYSVTSPGARVVAINPQATLTPSIAGFDNRFEGSRRMSFMDRYGYAPDMIDAAETAHIFYTPDEPEDAIHANLFRRPNVELYALPPLGAPAERMMMEMEILFSILAQASTGELDRNSVYRLLRARRDHRRYLRKLLARVQDKDRTLLAAVLCANVASRMHAPRFVHTLAALDKAAKEGQLGE